MDYLNLHAKSLVFGWQGLGLMKSCASEVVTAGGSILIYAAASSTL